MASAKQIETWVREVLRLAPRRVVRVRLRKESVAIEVKRQTYVIATRQVDFAQVAQALLHLGPSCAQEGAQHEH